VPLTVHGAVSPRLGFDFLQTMSMIHTLEHPIAQMIQLTSIVLDGVSLFPKLRIGFLKPAAGWIPYMMDRLDEKFHIDRKRKHFPLSKRPSEYFQRRQHLRHLRDRPRKFSTSSSAKWVKIISCTQRTFPRRQAGVRCRYSEFWEREDLSEGAKRKILSETPGDL